MPKKIDLKKVNPENVFEFFTYYDEKLKQIQGKAPCFMVIADKEAGLPPMIGQSKDMKKRKILVVVL